MMSGWEPCTETDENSLAHSTHSFSPVETERILPAQKDYLAMYKGSSVIIAWM